MQFESNGLLDLSLNRLLENENSLLETFISKQASFHRTCCNRFDRYHLQRKLVKLEKVHETAEDEPSDIKRRHSTRQLNSIEKIVIIVIICNKENSKENLRQLMTFKLDLRVRHGVKLLNAFDF